MTELLIVGGLTIDRFADGTSAPGGSVIHSGRAAAADGVRPSFLTVAGDEAEARDGLGVLAEMGGLHHQPAPTTTTYRHDEVGGRRILTYDRATQPIRPPAEPIEQPRVALLAPIADELPAGSVDALLAVLRPATVVYLIQGWLRRLELGQAVHPLPLDKVSGELWRAFGAGDAVVVSTEDLAESPEDPFAQSAVLRDNLGPRPVVVVTLGIHGYLLDDPSAGDVVATVPRRVVEGVPTVGAGDTFGVAFALHLSRGEEPEIAARAGTDAVIAMLEARRT